MQQELQYEKANTVIHVLMHMCIVKYIVYWCPTTSEIVEASCVARHSGQISIISLGLATGRMHERDKRSVYAKVHLLQGLQVGFRANLL